MVRAAGRRLNPDQHRRVPDFARDLARFGCNLTRSVYLTLDGIVHVGPYAGFTIHHAIRRACVRLGGSALVWSIARATAVHFAWRCHTVGRLAFDPIEWPSIHRGVPARAPW